MPLPSLTATHFCARLFAVEVYCQTLVQGAAMPPETSSTLPDPTLAIVT